VLIVYFVFEHSVVSIFISYIERISNVGILGCFKNESSNQKVQLLICNYLTIVALDTYF